MVGDAGVERHGRDGVDDGGVVRLLLVALAVRVDEQRDQAAQDGAAEAHGDHVEQVEVCGGEEERRRRAHQVQLPSAVHSGPSQFVCL